MCLAGRWWFDKWYERRLRLQVVRPMMGVGWCVLDSSSIVVVVAVVATTSFI